MYIRKITPILIKSLEKYPVLTLIGPRQSGKTTLVRSIFPQYAYTSLEDPDTREYAKQDPRGFLKGLGDHVILDEVQRVPDITSYLQTIVDAPKNKKKFILTGSNGLLVSDTVTQTLAGRTELFELLPLSVSEIFQKTQKFL
jgi:predicted AAA+ superfamily ATPase